MGSKINSQFAEEAAQQVIDAANSRWGGTGLVAEVRNHKSGMKNPYVFINCPKNHWRAVAKWLRFEMGADHCSMITGIHWPENTDAAWQVVVHLLRTGVKNPAVVDNRVHETKVDIGGLRGNTIPLEFEISMTIPDSRVPSVPSVADIWVGADWNEKETWDLVGINFDGHIGMRRVLLPHDSPTGYHPLQKQHKLRYHDFNEMYDDPQGFGRKPEDSGRVK